MNLITSSFPNVGHAYDADRKETQAQKGKAESTALTIPVRKLQDCSSPVSYSLFHQTLEIALESHRSEDGKGHSFDYRMLPLIEEYEDQMISLFTERHFLSSIGFGKTMWNHWFGDIGEEPPLPKDMGSILESPCPFNLGKKVIETHMLVLVPEKLDGTPMTLNRLGELMKSKGKSGYVQPCFGGGHEDISFEASHWVLMTKDVIDGSRSDFYQKQQKLVKKHPNYHLLRLSEAATAIFMEYLVTGVHHFSRTPWTYTRCLEKGAYGQMVVGGFASSGLDLGCDGGLAHVGVAVARKF